MGNWLINTNTWIKYSLLLVVVHEFKEKLQNRGEVGEVERDCVCMLTPNRTRTDFLCSGVIKTRF